MFVEPRRSRQKVGWIEVICGSMFSGKTEELIRRVNRAVIARQKVEIFKPSTDVRYHDSHVVSHNQNAVVSVPVACAADILSIVGDCHVVAIDEAQFFDEQLVEVCVTLANRGYRVIISGLDMDYRGVPFGPVPLLMSVAEYVTKLHAICVQCGEVALFSYRLSESEQQILLGERTEYEARCRTCFLEGMQKKEQENQREEQAG